MASTRPKSSIPQNRRINPNADRRKYLHSIVNACMHSDNPVIPLSPSYLNQDFQGFSDSCQSVVPPPLPPRVESSRYNRFSNYNSYCSPYSRFSPGLYAPSYGNYGTYGNYSRFGMPHDSYNSFIQLAEESTRPAFESIESVVDIVSSISMMLESSYHAVYSSYNAILGVVDQFSRLRDHVAQVLSFLALLRGLRYICLKILYLLKLRKDNPSVEAAWNQAKSVAGNPDISSFHDDGKSPWPFFMFLGLVIGAPWLMFKLLAKNAAKRPFDIRSWQGRNGYNMCIGNYDFKSTRKGELSFSAGEELYIAPQNLQANTPTGWLLVCNKENQIGLVPSNYLRKQQAQSSQRVRPVGPFDRNHGLKELQCTCIPPRPIASDEPSPRNTFPHPTPVEEPSKTKDPHE